MSFYPKQNSRVFETCSQVMRVTRSEIKNLFAVMKALFQSVEGKEKAELKGKNQS